MFLQVYLLGCCPHHYAFCVVFGAGTTIMKELWFSKTTIFFFKDVNFTEYERHIYIHMAASWNLKYHVHYNAKYHTLSVLTCLQKKGAIKLLSKVHHTLFSQNSRNMHKLVLLMLFTIHSLFTGLVTENKQSNNLTTQRLAHYALSIEDPLFLVKE